MSKKDKHIHKLFRVNGKHNKMFKCAFPDCVFLLHPGQFEILIGRYSLCHSCNNKFVITEQSLDEDMPICDDCRFKTVMTKIGIDENIVEEVTIDALDDFLSIKGM